MTVHVYTTTLNYVTCHVRKVNSNILKKKNTVNFWSIKCAVPILVAARSKAWVYGRSPAEIVGSNPTGVMDVVCCECCVLSGRGI